MPFRQTGQFSRRWEKPGGGEGMFAGRQLDTPVTGGETARTAIEEGADFKAPTYDQGRIKELTQEQLAPTITHAKRGVQAVQAGRYANPIARKLAIEGAIEASGRDISAGQGQATRTAASLYAPEYQGQMQEAIFKYRKALSDAELERKAKERERQETTTRSGGGASSGETYATAQRRLQNYDPFGGSRKGGSTTTSVAPANQGYASQITNGTKKRYALPEGPIKPVVLNPAIKAPYKPDDRSHELLTESFGRI